MGGTKGREKKKNLYHGDKRRNPLLLSDSVLQRKASLAHTEGRVDDCGSGIGTPGRISRKKIQGGGEGITVRADKGSEKKNPPS